MSYILEALKKAEAERNGAVQRAVPLLPPLVAASKTAPAWRRPLPVAGLAALAVTLAIAAWFFVSRDATRPPATPSAPAIVQPEPVVETVPPVAVAPPPDVPARQKEKPAPKKPVEKKRPPPAEPKSAKAPASEPAVGSLQDLPAEVQREIPALAISGYIYSGNKADRSVLVNNRLLREGDEAAPGLVLEKMTPSGMVLNYKGYRYRRGY